MVTWADRNAEGSVWWTLLLSEAEGSCSVPAQGAACHSGSTAQRPIKISIESFIPTPGSTRYIFISVVVVFPSVSPEVFYWIVLDTEVFPNCGQHGPGEKQAWVFSVSEDCCKITIAQATSTVRTHSLLSKRFAKQCNYLSLFRGNVQTGVRFFRWVTEVLAWDGLCSPFPETVHCSPFPETVRCSPLLGVCIPVPAKSRRWSREWRGKEHRNVAAPAADYTTHSCWITWIMGMSKAHGYPCRIGVWFNTIHNFEDHYYTFVILSSLNLRSS